MSTNQGGEILTREEIEGLRQQAKTAAKYSFHESVHKSFGRSIDFVCDAALASLDRPAPVKEEDGSHPYPLPPCPRCGTGELPYTYKGVHREVPKDNCPRIACGACGLKGPTRHNWLDAIEIFKTFFEKPAPVGGCPRDTDGDGNCGRRNCPHCGVDSQKHAPVGERPKRPETPGAWNDAAQEEYDEVLLPKYYDDLEAYATGLEERLDHYIVHYRQIRGKLNELAEGKIKGNVREFAEAVCTFGPTALLADRTRLEAEVIELKAALENKNGL